LLDANNLKAKLPKPVPRLVRVEIESIQAADGRERLLNRVENALYSHRVSSDFSELRAAQSLDHLIIGHARMPPAGGGDDVHAGNFPLSPPNPYYFS
jgi:hypothetical protein